MAIPPGMHRVTVDLPLPVYEAMQDAYLEDGVTAPARLRALAAVWQEDPQLAQRVAKVGLQMRADARRRAVKSRQATLAAREQEECDRRAEADDGM